MKQYQTFILAVIIYLLCIILSVIYGKPSYAGTASIDCKVIQSKVCDVYFDDDIGTPQNYQEVYKLAYDSKPNDLIRLHLAGNGGSGDGMLYLLGSLSHSKGRVIALIDGPVASAHATLAVAFGRPIITGYGYIYFHLISSTNTAEDYCSTLSGKDRGLPIYIKCIEDEKKTTESYNKVMHKYIDKYLTKEEIQFMEEGHDIIIDLDDFKRRLK